MTYRESVTAVSGAVLWRKFASSAPGPSLILPDGCLDLIWDGRRLWVAGPDTTARWFQGSSADRFTALRFSAGLGPALLGVPADALTDHSFELEHLWSAAEARRLTQQVAEDPVGALTTWLLERARRSPADPLGSRLATMAARGLPVATMADRNGMSARQLHRRCLPLFGYGPRHLARVLRLLRAVDEGRAGLPLAEVAAESGYYDQAHLSREIRALTGTTPTALLTKQGGQISA